MIGLEVHVYLLTKEMEFSRAEAIQILMSIGVYNKEREEAYGSP